MANYYNPYLAEKWQLNELVKLIDSFETDIIDTLKEKHIVSDYDYTCVLLNACGKAVVTFLEILVLCSFGYPDGAFSLSRNIYEQMILISFFERKKTSDDFESVLKNYYLDGAIKEKQEELRYYSTIEPESEKLCQTQKDLDSLKEKANPPLKKYREYWWTGCNNFSQMIEATTEAEQDLTYKQFLSTLHLTYKQACTTVHANSKGNIERLGYKPSLHIIDTSPTEKGH